MSNVWAQVNIGVPPRGGGTVAPGSFRTQALSITKSWGPQPEEAILTDVSSGVTVIEGAEMVLTIPGNPANHVFYGVAKRVRDQHDASGGLKREIHFVDSREYLKWDYIYGAFNVPDTRIVGGRRVRRFWSIFPDNFNSHIKSFHSQPYTAREVLDYIFASSTVETQWSRTYHADQVNAPVFSIDCMNGKRLDSVLSEISDQQGLDFGLVGGPYHLTWIRKGESLSAPSAPATSDGRVTGTALSGNPTRVRVLGDRNTYMMIDITMDPDWNTNWEKFYDPALFVHEIFQNGKHTDGSDYTDMPDDDADKTRGWFLASARAREITVREYATMIEDAAYLDPRRFSGRSRNEIPALIYINAILFRAFRPETGFYVNNASGRQIPLDSLEMVGHSIVKITHDPETGEMGYDPTQAEHSNGYAIARGFMVGHDAFKTIRPDNFDLEDFNSAQDVWQQVPFQIDDSGEDGQYILFDQPMIRSLDPTVQANEAEALVVERDGKIVLNAGVTLQPAPVRAALTFRAERFSYIEGVGGRDGVKHVAGLNAEYLTRYKGTLNNGAPRIEIPYADGQLASTKAAQLAANFLKGFYTYADGRWSDKVSTGQDITDWIDRVTVRVSPQGITQEVDATTPRESRGFTPQIDYGRAVRMQHTIPGQDALREEANAFRLTAQILKQSSQAMQFLQQTFDRMFGTGQSEADPAWMDGVDPVTPEKLLAGTPLWKAAGTRRAVLPENADDNHTVFVGVTSRENESASHPLHVRNSGLAYARVKGPITANSPIVRSNGNDYFEDQADDAERVPVGAARETIPDTSVKLIEVMLGAGGSGGGGSSVWV